jgi:hypothetical protein
MIVPPNDGCTHVKDRATPSDAWATACGIAMSSGGYWWSLAGRQCCGYDSLRLAFPLPLQGASGRFQDVGTVDDEALIPVRGAGGSMRC